MQTTPLPLWRAFTSDELISSEWYDSLHFLGSYWPGAYDAQSQIVKHFKEPDKHQDAPHSAIVSAYAEMIAGIARSVSVDAVVRVISSSETKPDASKPLSLLSDRVSTLLGVPVASDLFFRSDAREPMRYVERLSGPDALRQRLNYISQDLFIRPREIGKRILLIDDIYNLGATARLYSAAIKRFCGAEYVVCINLAATRFNGGKDSHGKLWLDLEKFSSLAAKAISRKDKKGWGSDPFGLGWVRDDVFHVDRECRVLGPEKARKTLRFLQAKDAKTCPECSKNVGWWSRVRRLLYR